MGRGPGPGSRRPRAEAQAGPRRARGGADRPARTRARLAQCELSATQSTSPRAVRAQRDGIRLRSILASPPGAMRAQVTSPKRLPPGVGGLADGAPDPGPHPAPPRRGARGTARPARPRTIGSEPAPPPAETRPSAPFGTPTTARAGSVSGADGPWTKRTATGAGPRTRSHCAPPAPSNPPFSAGSVDARGSTGSADGPELARGRAPRWSGRPGRRRSRAHAPGDFGSGRGGISPRARRRGRRLRAGRIQRRAHR